jgi:hypothetical protein
MDDRIVTTIPAGGANTRRIDFVTLQSCHASRRRWRAATSVVETEPEIVNQTQCGWHAHPDPRSKPSRRPGTTNRVSPRVGYWAGGDGWRGRPGRPLVSSPAATKKDGPEKGG